MPARAATADHYYVNIYCKGPAAHRAWAARAGGAPAQADRDGALRKTFSERTVAVPTPKRPAECFSYVHLCHVSTCPALSNFHCARAERV